MGPGEGMGKSLSDENRIVEARCSTVLCLHQRALLAKLREGRRSITDQGVACCNF